MQFLAPLFLAALAALAVPILLHVRRQQPRERVPFSAVQFLDAAQPIQRREMRLQDILLLLLRCLAIGLLAFAFARPFFGSSSILAETPAAFRLILLDTSASMRGERFSHVQKDAERVVNEASPQDLIAIGSFDETFLISLSFQRWQEIPASERKNTALAAIRSLKPTWRATNFGSSWTAAADFLDQARDSTKTPGIIYLLSDFQRGASTGELVGFEWPSHIQVITETLATGAWTNAGVHPVTSHLGSKISEARIMNSAGSEDTAFALAWNNEKSQPFEINPGQGHSARIPDTSRGNIAVLSGDPFDFDNRAWFAPVTTVAITIDYFGLAKPDDTTNSLFFLSRALNSSPDFKIDLRVNPSASATRPTFTIIDGPVDPSAAAELRKQLESGGQALVVLRDTAMPLTAITGGQPAISEAVVDGSVLFGEISFDDPVFQPFSDPKYSNFSHIYTWHYRKLDPARIPGARTLAAFGSGDPALLRVPIGRGALFVLTTSWRPADGQLALSSKFVPLLHSLIAQSSGTTQAETNVSIGDVVPLPSQADTQVVTPSGASVQASGGKFAATDTPGLYHTADQRFTFAVNPRGSESELTPLSDSELKSLGLPLEKIDPSKATETIRRAMAQEEIERQQKWWWWLILAAITALIAESALAAWFSQKRTQAAPA